MAVVGITCGYNPENQKRLGFSNIVKVIPLPAIEELGGRGGIAPTHS
jgi:hypothetical protein